jgi:hypothetical protein
MINNVAIQVLRIMKAWMEGEKSDFEGQKKRKLSENQVSSYCSSSSESVVNM